MMDDLLQLVKNKKELKGLDDAFVRRKMLEHKLPAQQNPKSKEVRAFVKEVRKELRQLHGAFALPAAKRQRWLQDFTQGKIDRRTLDVQLLSSHRSTKERLDCYAELYPVIWAITGLPKRIVDLGCGLNPCSYSFLACTPQYDAHDLSSTDAAFLNEYFLATKTQGHADVCDLITTTKIFTGDVCFLFKVVDALEKEKATAKLFERIATAWVVVSFPMASLSGRQFKATRHWFDGVLTRKKKTFTVVTVGNERFYVIKWQ